MLIEQPEAPNLLVALVRNADDATSSDHWLLICAIVFALMALLSPIAFEWLSRFM